MERTIGWFINYFVSKKFLDIFLCSHLHLSFNDFGYWKACALSTVIYSEKIIFQSSTQLKKKKKAKFMLASLSHRGNHHIFLPLEKFNASLCSWFAHEHRLLFSRQMGRGCHAQHRVSCLKLLLPQLFRIIHFLRGAKTAQCCCGLWSATWILWHRFVLSMQKPPAEGSLLIQSIEVRGNRQTYLPFGFWWFGLWRNLLLGMLLQLRDE